MSHTLQTPWYNKTIDALQLAGKGDRTQECYARSVRQLLEYVKKDPLQITEQELQAYFLFRRNTSNWSASTLNICYCGLRFFFIHVLQKKWPVFEYLKAQKEKRLPCVLNRDEVLQVLQQVHTFHNYVYLTTVYTCGLRLQEALYLQTSDIDAKRMMIHVHRGKGAKDRYVPLPEETLALLRKYWATHRNQVLIFPALGRGHQDASKSKTPMAIDSVQGAFRSAKHKTGINKRRVTIHTLRHSYATHLLEEGVNIRVIQRYLGHTMLETTMVYLHLTQKGQEDAYTIINQTMKGFNNGYRSGYLS
jgi:site-specific recombinase XerD